MYRQQLHSMCGLLPSLKDTLACIEEIRTPTLYSMPDPSELQPPESLMETCQAPENMKNLFHVRGPAHHCEAFVSTQIKDYCFTSPNGVFTFCISC